MGDVRQGYPCCRALEPLVARSLDLIILGRHTNTRRDDLEGHPTLPPELFSLPMILRSHPVPELSFRLVSLTTCE
jgi:hypothetical protein